MTWQRRNQRRRRRGGELEMYGKKLVTDKRGNQQWEPDALVAVIPAPNMTTRSYAAEVNGQEWVERYRFMVDDTPQIRNNIGLFTYIKWLGIQFDIETPPVLSVGGSDHVRHWTFDVRRH